MTNNQFLGQINCNKALPRIADMLGDVMSCAPAMNESVGVVPQFRAERGAGVGCLASYAAEARRHGGSDEDIER